jgi:hypothetical protein
MDRRIKVGRVAPNTRSAPTSVRDLREFDPLELERALELPDEPPLRRRRDPLPVRREA